MRHGIWFIDEPDQADVDYDAESTRDQQGNEYKTHLLSAESVHTAVGNWKGLKEGIL
jgi:hypothetical protein